MAAQSDTVCKPIISLTSYPARIPFITPCIDSLIRQTAEYKKIILWLSQEEFPDGESSLPKSLLAYKEQGYIYISVAILSHIKNLFPACRNILMMS